LPDPIASGTLSPFLARAGEGSRRERDDAHQRGSILQPQQVPAAYWRGLERLELCASAARLCLATDLELRALGWAHESMIIQEWNSEVAWEQMHAGRLSGFALTVPTIGDPSLAPEGLHLLSMTSFRCNSTQAPLTESEADERSRLMLAQVEKLIPSISSHLALEALPKGYHLQPFGPIYGWAATPRQSGIRRLGQRTPISGLHLVGQWTRPGHGVIAVVLSGEAVTHRVLGTRKQ